MGRLFLYSWGCHQKGHLLFAHQMILLDGQVMRGLPRPLNFYAGTYGRRSKDGITPSNSRPFHADGTRYFFSFWKSELSLDFQLTFSGMLYANPHTWAGSQEQCRKPGLHLYCSKSAVIGLGQRGRFPWELSASFLKRKAHERKSRCRLRGRS